MIKVLLIFILIFAQGVFSAPSNAGKTINTWVYYEFLRIEEKEAQKRFAEVEEGTLETGPPFLDRNFCALIRPVTPGRPSGHGRAWLALVHLFAFFCRVTHLPTFVTCCSCKSALS